MTSRAAAAAAAAMALALASAVAAAAASAAAMPVAVAASVATTAAVAVAAVPPASSAAASRATAAATPQVSTQLFPEAPERPIVVRACAACHAPELVVAKRHTADEWDEIIAKMVDRGAIATEDEQQQILEYLLRFYGPS